MFDREICPTFTKLYKRISHLGSQSCLFSTNFLTGETIKTRFQASLLTAPGPGQKDSQVVVSWKLGSTCDSVCPGLSCTCVRWLALTLVEIKFVRKSTQFFHRLIMYPTQVNLRLPVTTYEFIRLEFNNDYIICSVSSLQPNSWTKKTTKMLIYLLY